MDKHYLTQTAWLLRAIATHLNSLHGASEHIPDKPDREEFERRLRAVIAAINTDILPIVERQLLRDDPLKSLERFKAVDNLP